MKSDRMKCTTCGESDFRPSIPEVRWRAVPDDSPGLNYGYAEMIWLGFVKQCIGCFEYTDKCGRERTREEWIKLANRQRFQKTRYHRFWQLIKQWERDLR